MGNKQDAHWATKVFYRPIEVAIRWCGLVKSETEILRGVNDQLPRPRHLERWPSLVLYLDRIFDAILNGDLPYGHRGITVSQGSPENDPELTVRHVDLRAWLTQFYPDQKPPFLFAPAERIVHQRIGMDLARTLTAERDTLQTLLEQRIKAHEQSLKEIRQLEHRLKSLSAGMSGTKSPDARAETTYLNIIGGLLSLLLQDGTTTAFSPFTTQTAVIEALIEAYPNRPGLKERTLLAKFAAAKRQLKGS